MVKEQRIRMVEEGHGIIKRPFFLEAVFRDNKEERVKVGHGFIILSQGWQL